MIERVDPLLGTVLDGKYRLDHRIAAGGFGAIYQASHVETGVELAVKVVHARLASDPGIVARFKREGEALTALRSPHTITAYELGETAEGVLYIAMELLRGANLYQRLRDGGPIPWRRMVSIAIGVCHSLAEAHALGVVHRDLKPTNIHLEPRGPDGDFVKVLDFGIAKILQHSQLESSGDLTTAGIMIGTLDYMSPEQMVGGEITGASDLYTLGIVIYEMIAGKRPFPQAPTAASVLAAMLKAPAPLGSVASVPVELERIVMRCLERDAEHRYQTADELAADLTRLLERAERSERRSRSYDSAGDDDATQIAQVRAMSPTLMAAAAPPPPGLPATSSPTATPSRPFPASRSKPPPLPAPPLPAPPRGRDTGPPPPAEAPRPAEPPRPANASSPGLGLPPAPDPAMRVLPVTPISTLRGVALPGRDGGRTGTDATTVDPPASQPSPGRRGYDPARVAQRDAMVRRVLWASVILIASLIGLVLAARL